MGQNDQGVKQKKVPERQCLGCNQHKPKKEMLIEFFRTPSGSVMAEFEESSVISGLDLSVSSCFKGVVI